MDFPKELKYTKDHEWIKVEGEKAYIGITDFAQRELGDIVFVEVNTTGKELSENDCFGTVEAVKTVSDLFMPVAGSILEVNPKLVDNAELLNQDPYGEGWIIKIQIKDASQLEQLLSSDAYKKELALS